MEVERKWQETIGMVEGGEWWVKVGGWRVEDGGRGAKGQVFPLPAVSQICIVILAPSMFIFLTCGVVHVNLPRWEEGEEEGACRGVVGAGHTP